MSIEKRQTKVGVLYRFDKTVRGVRIRSLFIYPSKRRAVEAQAEAVTDYLRTGRVSTPSALPGTQKSVLELLTERVTWLHENRSGVHAHGTAGLFRRALEYASDWANRPVLSISLDMVREWAIKWKKDLEGRGKTAKSVNDALIAFQAAWNHPWDSTRAKPTYPNNPFAEFDRFPVESKTRFVPETAVIDQVLQAASSNDDLFLYLQILYETAARPSEPLKLTWIDISFERHTVTLYTKKKKGGKKTARRLVVSEELAEALRRRQNMKPSSVFVFQQAREERATPLASINKFYKETCAITGVKYFELYCWRHWRASKWDQEGRPLTEIQAKLGHEQATMTDRYLHDLHGR